MSKTSIPSLDAMVRSDGQVNCDETASKLSPQSIKEIKQCEQKVPMHLLLDFAGPLQAIAELAEVGAKKYREKSWQHFKSKDGITVYTDALLRHIFDTSDDIYDKETHILHATAVAFNALARLHFILEVSPNKNSNLSCVEVNNDHI